MEIYLKLTHTYCFPNEKLKTRLCFLCCLECGSNMRTDVNLLSGKIRTGSEEQCSLPSASSSNSALSLFFPRKDGPLSSKTWTQGSWRTRLTDAGLQADSSSECFPRSTSNARVQTSPQPSLAVSFEVKYIISA